LDHLHEMARVNVSGWRAGNERYLSFAKRRSSGDEFTRYFREFIGCDEFTESRALTSNLLEALRAYSEADEAEPEVRFRRRQRVFDYCEEKRAAGERVNLAALSGRLSDEDPESFLRFLNENHQFSVGDDFAPDSVYRKLQRFGGSDKRLSIAFDAELLDNRVVFDPNEGTLLIKDIPANLRHQLDRR
jgi:nucleoid-associated protein